MDRSRPGRTNGELRHLHAHLYAPNAMAYATGLITSKDMIKVVLLVSLLSILALMAGYFWVLPLALKLRHLLSQFLLGISCIGIASTPILLGL